jgi:predicted metal-dependent phosphoesterase TrpH
MEKTQVKKVNIYDAMYQRYQRALRGDLIEMSIAQLDGEQVWLEYTTQTVTDYEEVTVIKKIDLYFISRGEDTEEGYDDTPFFHPYNSIDENARLFVEELDEVDIVNCFDILEE